MVQDKAHPYVTLRGLLAAVLSVSAFLMAVSPVRADEDIRSIELYNGGKTETVSVGRSPRPASQTAENITVVTASEIQALNAHTLADVLNTMPGVEFQIFHRTPGSVSSFQIQGSGANHILVLVDNVPINNLADNIADVASIPVQMIERLELVKGAASSSWGSALGGVVNVITKAPNPDRLHSGEVSASLGEKRTVDGRLEISGSGERLGYYVTGGKLRSDGLMANNMVDLDHLYGKVLYDLYGRGTVFFSVSLVTDSSGQFGDPSGFIDNGASVPPSKGGQDTRRFISTFGADYALTDRLSLQAAVKDRFSHARAVLRDFNSGQILKEAVADDQEYGLSLLLSHQGDRHRVALGLDYEHVKAEQKAPLLVQADLLDRNADRFGVYLNDAITLGNLTLIPSARYDRTATGGDQFSPSFGFTYALSDNSVLRGYTARGYSLTSLERLDSTEKVWTSQVGVETGSIPFLWLKATLFRNDTWNVTVSNSTEKQRHLKQGIELEYRTLPLWNTSLSGGYTYIDARNTATDQRVTGTAEHNLKLGLLYQNDSSFTALLTANYLDWMVQTPHNQDVLCDLHLSKKWVLSDQFTVELFGSIHNLFNSSHYQFYLYKNSPRWAEAGARCSF